jgi:pyrimidine-nucleoside phosphorylase/thymidine phosphorylase
VTALEIIRHKRDGGELSTEAIRFFIRGVSDGTLPDYQASAMLMAICCRGLSERELVDWTEAMLRSGEVLDLGEVSGPKIDKHSTGGVGDLVSLCLAPLVASCGVRVPMIAGRGLGHTGGTIDKLEAIPGFRTDLSKERFVQILQQVGCCIIAQTGWIAPADRVLYALRDVTGTVESIPLIAASIMSKKLAEGLDGLVLDVKVGAGALIKTAASAEQLARTLVAIGERMGLRTRAVLTAMEEPLGVAVGNAVEVREAWDVLCGRGPDDVRELTLHLGAEMLLLAGAGSLREAHERVRDALDRGLGRRKLLEMIEAQGGNPADVPDHLPRGNTFELRAESAGYLQVLDAGIVGEAVVRLGAGRLVASDKVDPAVGIVLSKKVGARVAAGDTLCTVHYRDPAKLAEALALLTKAVRIGDVPPSSAFPRDGDERFLEGLQGGVRLVLGRI